MPPTMQDEGSGDRVRGSWFEDRRFVLEELKRLSAKGEGLGTEIADLRSSFLMVGPHEKLETRVRVLEGSVAGLLVRASFWGALMGLVPVVLLLAMRAIFGK